MYDVITYSLCVCPDNLPVALMRCVYLYISSSARGLYNSTPEVIFSVNYSASWATGMISDRTSESREKPSF